MTPVVFGGLAARLPPADLFVAPVAGLAAREPRGVPLGDMTRRTFWPGRLLLLPSVSLPEPARPRANEGCRDMRPSGRGVAVPLLLWPCCFLTFLRLDSLPLASERLGDPGRLREEDETCDFLEGSPCFSLRPDGVLAPMVEAPDAGFSPSLPLPFCWTFSSSSFLRSSSLRRSASESSDSL
jgi:hypothetical protein